MGFARQGFTNVYKDEAGLESHEGRRPKPAHAHGPKSELWAVGSAICDALSKAGHVLEKIDQQ